MRHFSVFSAQSCQKRLIVLFSKRLGKGLFKKEFIMNIINATVDYFRSSKNELGKVTWPSKDQTTRYSILVIGTSLAIALFFGALDVGLGRVVSASLANKTSSAPAAAEQTVPTTVDLNQVQVDAQTAPNTAQPTVDFTNVAPNQDGQSETPNF